MYDYSYEEVSASNSGGKFGLNQGAKIVKFEFNPNGGKDESLQDSCDVTIEIDDKEFRARQFPVQRAYDNNVEITDPKHEKFVLAVKNANATLCDIVAAVAGDEAVKLALATARPKDYKTFIDTLERTLKMTPNWDKALVDVFLQYQYAVTGDNTRTFLQLPKTDHIKHGKWICKHIPADFERDNSKSIKYFAKETGVKHPFSRSEWFATSAFGTQIILGEDEDASGDSAETTSGGW